MLTLVGFRNPIVTPDGKPIFEEDHAMILEMDNPDADRSLAAFRALSKGKQHLVQILPKPVERIIEGEMRKARVIRIWMPHVIPAESRYELKLYPVMRRGERRKKNQPNLQDDYSRIKREIDSLKNFDAESLEFCQAAVNSMVINFDGALKLTNSDLTDRFQAEVIYNGRTLVSLNNKLYRYLWDAQLQAITGAVHALLTIAKMAEKCEVEIKAEWLEQAKEFMHRPVQDTTEWECNVLAEILRNSHARIR